MKRIGVDVGGTFTDLIYVDDETGVIKVHKLATTPDDPSLGTINHSLMSIEALRAILQQPSDPRWPDAIAVVVSRGGRPDLAGAWLAKVEAPTLLIVGGHDYAVIDLNREAQLQLRCVHLLEVVSGATHLFEEPGTLDQVITHASRWFSTWFAKA